MDRFIVVLQGEKKDEYFTRHNEIVEGSRRDVWTDFDEANKAAMRARLQDPLNRKVVVVDY